MEEQERQNELYIINPETSIGVINKIVALRKIRDIGALRSVSKVLCEKEKDNPYLHSAVVRYCQNNRIPLTTTDNKKSIDEFLKEEVASKKASGRAFVHITEEKDFGTLESMSENMRESNVYVELVRIYS